ncbi:MAG: hypothetical protein V7603_6193 [Micromonosporaceae bacterium]
MRKVFAGLASLMMLAVVVQFFLAGFGAFDTAPKDEAFRSHRALGYLILLVAVALTVVAALVRAPGRLVGLSGLVVGLTILQPVIASIAKAFGDSADTSTLAGELVFGLHAVNALVIMSVVRIILKESRAMAAGANPARPVDGSAAADPARSAS